MKILGMLLLIAVAQTAHSQELSVSEAASGDVRPIEVEHYAKNYSVTLSEAERRTKILSALAGESLPFHKEFSGRFAGIYIDHIPELRVVVRLTGKESVSPRTVLKGEGGIPVVFTTGAAATLEELESSVAVNRNKLFLKIPELEDIYADEKTGDIVLIVHADDIESKAYLSELPAISKLLGHKARFKFYPVASEEMAYARGGALTSTCTTGFAVREVTTNQKMILTAAHCQNDQAYANYVTPGQPGYVTFPLNYIDEKNDTTHDVQWHIPSTGNTPLGEIYGTSTSDNQGRVILFSWGRQYIRIGQVLCQRGHASGYSCGEVVNKNASSKCGKLPCGNTWVRLEGPDLACTRGDSGGPVFYQNSAYGMIKAASSRNPSPGACYGVTFMSVDFIHSLGFELL